MADSDNQQNTSNAFAAFGNFDAPKSDDNGDTGEEKTNSNGFSNPWGPETKQEENSQPSWCSFGDFGATENQKQDNQSQEGNSFNAWGSQANDGTTTNNNWGWGSGFDNSKKEDPK